MNNNIKRGSHISLSWFPCRSSILVDLEFRVLVFVEGGKPENPERNPLSKVKTNNKPNPHKRHRARIEPTPH